MILSELRKINLFFKEDYFMNKAKKELVIITGMSGAGKSEAMKFFEDREYFCIDNFPINLFQYLNEIFISSEKRNQVAIAIDVRNKEFIEQLTKQLEILDKEEISHTMIYLDARTDVLLSRYELSRRKHPLNMYDTLLANIKEERKIIKDFMMKADLVIDTSTLSVKELQEILEKEFSGQRKKISVNLTSFGFKYGIPLDLHLMFDLRFLPNPYYLDELKNKTGNHKDVQDYVMGLSESQEFYNMLLNMLLYLIPKYEEEGKSHLRIGIGCSGGQHRSATFVNKLYDDLSKKLEYHIGKFHREVGDKKEI